ncbi:MAG: 7-carboxy-7-deazaguanine synthase QueE [Gammaproteobacteria bacterium]|nr:7-carboxy-7-deazaguanine synthase QueE [Gammaproteobacteria bacterium]
MVSETQDNSDGDAGPAIRLRITEIFHSLQGESRTVGIPTTFIRLTGCPLRCGYCDSAYAFEGGEWMSLDQVLLNVISQECHYVTVTGGEPLAQKNCFPLLSRLCDLGYQVSLETSGSIDITKVDPRVVKVMDLKTPESGEEAKNRYENIKWLQNSDQIKFVICSRDDYLWACKKLVEYDLPSQYEILFQAVHHDLEDRVLAEWILEDHLQVRMQVQLHKLLWGDLPGK